MSDVRLWIFKIKSCLIVNILNSKHSKIVKPFRGQNFNELKLTHGPNKLFEDPFFPANNDSLCLNREPPEGFYLFKYRIGNQIVIIINLGIVWMRPRDVHPNAKFCGANGCRFDLDYGALGNCW